MRHYLKASHSGGFFISMDGWYAVGAWMLKSGDIHGWYAVGAWMLKNGDIHGWNVVRAWMLRATIAMDWQNTGAIGTFWSDDAHSRKKDHGTTTTR